MKKTQLALAAVALVASSAAMAQVTVYGTADVAVVTSSAGTALAGAGNSGTSLIGFKGTEDLGSGLKAGFALETGYSAAAGTLGNGGFLGNGAGGTGNNNVNALFNRQANISLSTEAIGITLGTQISPFILAGLAGTTAVGGNGAFVPALLRLDGGSVATVTTNGNPTGGFFIQDAANINFNAGAFSGNVMYRVREKSSTDDGYTAANLITAVGGVNLAAGYQKRSSTTAANETRNYLLAANTEIAGVRLNAAYSNNEIGTTSSNGYIIGASMPLTGALSAGLTYAYNSKITNSRQVTASVQYDLSKRTYAYANYSSFNTAVNGGFASNDAGGLGTAKSLLAVGVAHSF